MARSRAPIARIGTCAARRRETRPSQGAVAARGAAIRPAPRPTRARPCRRGRGRASRAAHASKHCRHGSLTRARREHVFARRCPGRPRRMADQTQNTNTEKDPAEWVTGDEPMTGAQQSYLKTLSQEADEPFDPEISKAEASRRIDELQGKTGRGR